ncbi:MAG: DUF1152 domain-containing protein [Candidatus Absconditicoccaceae bacterium]
MFPKHFSNKYNNALVLGTGGGNDIVSALIVALDLQKQGIKTDIAGMLSPGAIHYFDGQKEQAVNRISGEIKRFINSKSLKEISFVDGFLPGIASQQGVNIDNYYDLSTRFGTKKLSDELNKIILQNQYDLFVAVDVGGDILARGKDDDTLLSPIMDFTSLYLLNTLNIDNDLIEFGLLTDGELRPKGAKEILEELASKGLLLDQSDISLEDYNVQTFIKIFDEIKKIRAGHTGVMTIETLKNIGSQKDIDTKYRFRSQIGKDKWHTSFDVNLPYQYFGKTYLIDGKKFAEDRLNTSFSYENTLDQYIKLKSIQPKWKTEMDLFYLWSGDNRTSTQQEGYCMQFLVPSNMIDIQSRKEIIYAGIEQLSSGESDLLLIYKDDISLVKSDQLKIKKAGNFYLVYQENIEDFIHSTAEQIINYQNFK